jgi:hypothetical protein
MSTEIEDDKPPMPFCRDGEGLCEQTETDAQFRAVAMERLGLGPALKRSNGLTMRSRPTITRKAEDKRPQAPLPDDGKSQVISKAAQSLNDQRSTENGSAEVPIEDPKSTKQTNPVATAQSKNEPRERPRRPRRISTIIDDDWTRRERKRRHRNVTLWLPKAKEQTQPKKPEAVAESKYEPTDYERTVLAKQAERLKDQVRVPRIKFVEDVRGGRQQFDHPDQFIASVLLKEAFGTADDQFAEGLLHYLCAALPADEYSAYEYPRARDLNHAISIIAAGKPVDEIHAQILADLAVCRIILARLLHNVSDPIKFYLPEELRIALQHYKYKAEDQIDREVKIDNRPVLEFSIRSVTRLITLCIELLDAANRYRATFESSRTMQQLSAVTPVEASLGEIKLATPNARPKKANAARAHRLNGSAVTKLRQKTDSTMARKGNGHTST